MRRCCVDQRDLRASTLLLGDGYVDPEKARPRVSMGVWVRLVGWSAPHADPQRADVLRTVVTDEGIGVVEKGGRGLPAQRVARAAARASSAVGTSA